MKDKSKKSTYSTTFGIDPKILIIYSHLILVAAVAEMVEVAGVEPAS